MADLENGQSKAVEALTDAEEKRVYQPDELWTDTFALKVAVQDFQWAESYRNQNCDWRWTRANRLYEAFVEQKYWQGTRQPRASLGIFLCFEQIESILPKVMQAIFADAPWFQADPLGPTTPRQATEWQYLIQYQLDKQNVREKFRRCIKSALLYGNGIMKLNWCIKETERQQWIPKMRKRMSQNPLMGQMDQGYERIIDKQVIKKQENYPELDYVALTDFYVDPNCPSPSIDDARYVCERQLVTVDYLDSLRDAKEYKIPSKVDLLKMVNQKTSSQGDQTKVSAESARMGSWMPSTDYTVDPGGGRIEVIAYTTEDRVVWVANRGKVILNVPNSYGFINYYDAFYADVLDRFYALGVCDVIGGEQQFKQSLRNARLDELSLAIHRPLIRKLGLKVPEYQRIVKPGQQWEAENPRDDFVFLDIPNITQNAFIEDQYADMRAQKTTGVSDLAVLGTPSAGGNSASRTATGVGVQAQASAGRLQYLVENLEDTFIEPMLNDLVILNKMFPPIGMEMADTVALSRIEITMRASAKMQSKMSLMQTLPVIMQTIANPSFISELAMQNKTPDWTELFRMVTDMTGYRNRVTLIRDLTPEEKQSRNQPPAEEMIKMQMQKERIAGQAKITQMKLLAERDEQDTQREDDNESESTDGLLKLTAELIKQKAQRDKAKKDD